MNPWHNYNGWNRPGISSEKIINGGGSNTFRRSVIDEPKIVANIKLKRWNGKLKLLAGESDTSLRYEVVDEIHGGFGKVEKLRSPTGSFIARKTFDPNGQVNLSREELQKLKKRFIREVKVQSELPSEYILPIFEYDLEYDLECERPWFTMPWAEKTLSQQIELDRKAGTITRGALSDILNAIEKIHELGYVHRDLKPDNVLFHNGVWKLGDFGLVLPPSDQTTQLTTMGSNWGTQFYCAPEQASDFKHATPAADIYSDVTK